MKTPPTKTSPKQKVIVDNKNILKKCSKIVEKLIEDDTSIPFRKPVNWKKLKLTNYPEIVKKPMDLSKISANLKRNAYKSIEECLQDIQQIWENCKLFNESASVSFFILF
jgi:hypothetical protein